MEVCDPALDCQPGTPAQDDGIFCTNDSCDEQSMTVTNTPDASVCNDDNNVCTVTVCDVVTGCGHELAQTPECFPSLPAASPAGRVLLGLLVLGAGVLFLTGRRRRMA
jgi:hypothetical protein